MHFNSQPKSIRSLAQHCSRLGIPFKLCMRLLNQPYKKIFQLKLMHDFSKQYKTGIIQLIFPKNYTHQHHSSPFHNKQTISKPPVQTIRTQKLEKKKWINFLFYLSKSPGQRFALPLLASAVASNNFDPVFFPDPRHIQTIFPISGRLLAGKEGGLHKPTASSPPTTPAAGGLQLRRRFVHHRQFKDLGLFEEEKLGG